MPSEATTRRVSKCALFLVMLGLVFLIVLHAIEPGYSVANNYVSEYAWSGHGYLMTIAFIVLGFSAIILSVLLRDLRLDGIYKRLIVRTGENGGFLWPLLLAGLFVALLAFFPTDTGNPYLLSAAPHPGVRTPGRFHDFFVTVGFALAIVSILAFTLEFDFAPRVRWAALKVPNFFLFCFMLPSLITYVLIFLLSPAKPILGQGFTERLLIFSFIAWIIMVDCAYLMHPRNSGREEHIRYSDKDTGDEMTRVSV